MRSKRVVNSRITNHMSVFTLVNEEALSYISSRYPIGAVHSLVGIQAGIENSNFFLSTSEGEFILTVFESLQIDEVPFCMQLMNFLTKHGVPCAEPLATFDSNYVIETMGKPVSIVRRLVGKSIIDVTKQHIVNIGLAMGRWHRATACGDSAEGFGQQRANKYDKKWRTQTSAELLPKLTTQDKELLQNELDLQRLYTHVGLPQGIIHSDLFRDNALFVESRLSGVIDLYDACTGILLYDLAVLVNDWCRSLNGSIDAELTQLFLASYHSERNLNSLERGAWPVIMRLAALRFWLSRLAYENRQNTANIHTNKDSEQYKIILQNCVLEENLLTHLWVI